MGQKLWVVVEPAGNADMGALLWGLASGTPIPFRPRGSAVDIVRGWPSLERLLAVWGPNFDATAIELEVDEIERRCAGRGWDIYLELDGGRRLLRKAPPPAAPVQELLVCQSCGATCGSGELESFGRCPNCGGRSLDPIGEA